MTTPAEPVPTDNDPAATPGPAHESVGDPPRHENEQSPERPHSLCDAVVRLGSGETGCGCAGSDEDAPLWPHPLLRVDDPGEFIAAVPALLGFVPHRSLVVCLLQEAPERPDSLRLGTVARHDLDVPGCGAWARLAAQLAAICVQEQTLAVLVLVVDDRAGAPRTGSPGARSARHRDLIRVLEAALRAEDVPIADACAVREITADALWWSLLDPDCVGVQTDPAASPVTLAHVLDGRPVRSSRAELADVVAADPVAADEVAAQLEPAAAQARHRYRRAVCRRDPNSYSRAALEMVLWLISATDSGDRIDARELADLAVALRDRTVRDAVFALAVGVHAQAAEALWGRLCRAVTGADRAEAAALLGYSAYVRGDGPLAGVALEAALDADPTHSIAALLETALHTGMPPQEIRKLAHSGRDKAAALGIDLGIDPDRSEP
ncbi:DUF4192 domain-containing protein [Nocardia transvalensis]|uniref:DUF4192 domain-containing protein n=1 Tax=Nocardia transvalensis TaxID=37333 RepID=UPI001893E06F|nr:DUF4192 domain-containing protein [Nocardia transvalensis]MBF6329673.1 DUF4192 domain-containing protein [Nocardia transvalensis]